QRSAGAVGGGALAARADEGSGRAAPENDAARAGADWRSGSEQPAVGAPDEGDHAAARGGRAARRDPRVERAALSGAAGRVSEQAPAQLTRARVRSGEPACRLPAARYRQRPTVD